MIQNPCPNCGELILHDDERLECEYCGYACDYPYSDDEDE